LLLSSFFAGLLALDFFFGIGFFGIGFFGMTHLLGAISSVLAPRNCSCMLISRRWAGRHHPSFANSFSNSPFSFFFSPSDISPSATFTGANRISPLFQSVPLSWNSVSKAALA